LLLPDRYILAVIRNSFAGRVGEGHLIGSAGVAQFAGFCDLGFIRVPGNIEIGQGKKIGKRFSDSVSALGNVCVGGEHGAILGAEGCRLGDILCGEDVHPFLHRGLGNGYPPNREVRQETPGKNANNATKS
jgi:hypothetical protein